MKQQGRGAAARPGRLSAALLGIALAALACRHGGPKPAPDPPARTFTCGEATCDARTSYCERRKTDYAPLPDTYACRPLPAACLPPDPRSADCRCFPNPTRCGFC